MTATATPPTSATPVTPPSATYQRLRLYIAKRMRMSPIDQPMMLMELLGRRSPAQHRTWPAGSRGKT
jgi:hypothetical protein